MSDDRTDKDGGTWSDGGKNYDPPAEYDLPQYAARNATADFFNYLGEGYPNALKGLPDGSSVVLEGFIKDAIEGWR